MGNRWFARAFEPVISVIDLGVVVIESMVAFKGKVGGGPDPLELGWM